MSHNNYWIYVDGHYERCVRCNRVRVAVGGTE